MCYFMLSKLLLQELLLQFAYSDPRLLNNGLILASEHYKDKDGATVLTVEWLSEAGIVDSFCPQPSRMGC